MRSFVVPFAAALLSSVAQAQVGISVDIVQPGVYGRIEIGNRPPPVIYAQPVVIVPEPHPGRPLYLYVPPGHQKNWRKHCGRYDACGRPVYFVREDWVQARYDDRHHGGKHDHKHKHKDDHKGHGKGKGHGHGKHDD